VRLTSPAGRPRLRFAFVIAAAVLVAAGTPLLAGAALADPAAPAPGVPGGPVTAALTAVDSALADVAALPPTPNTAYGLGPDGRVVLTVSDAAPAAGAARLLALARRLGAAVTVEHAAGPLTEQLLGGDKISDGSILCSVGFAVTRGVQSYVLTAGHCTAGLPRWQGVGPSVSSRFPGTDYGLVRDDSAQAEGAVDQYDGTMQPITGVGTPTVGEKVCASGMATGVTCGEVLAVGQTVDYGDGAVVHGLVKTNVHTDHGDSGGPLYDGSTGLGTVSGGDGTTDYFQPLAPVLAAENLDLG
jgi:streptogrisin D